MFKQLIFFILILFPSIIYAQGSNNNKLNEKGQKTGLWITFDNNGNKIYEGHFFEGHPVDTLKRYYPDGNIKAIMVYDSTGSRVEAMLYDEEKRIRAKGMYINRMKNGTWDFYGTHGQPIFKISYENDTVSGKSERYFINGRIMEKTSWKNNKMHGLQEIYNENGDKISEHYYSNGKLEGKYIVYNDNGAIAVIGYYKDDLKEGDWVYYKESGEKDYTLIYTEGKLQNPDILDQRQQKVFEQYEKNRNMIKDPDLYTSDPQSYFKK
jgi:antitoxin component YwqK of YwqJK toxin-antitoxin module